MKKIFCLSFFICLLNVSFTFSQFRTSTDLDPSLDNNSVLNVQQTNENNFQNIITPIQTETITNTVLPTDGGNSQNGRAPMGGRRFIRSVYLITPGEMNISGFGAAQVTSVGWSYLSVNVAFPQNIPTNCDSLVIYLQSTADATYLKGTSWSAAIVGMTKAYRGPYAIPSGLGPHFIDVTMGGLGTLPFSTIAGQGVYVAFEYTSNVGNPIAASTASANMSCNFQGLVPGIATGQSQIAHTNTMATSAFRPETRFGGPGKAPFVDIVSVSTLWSLGRAGVCACPDTNIIRTVVDHLRPVFDTIVVTTTVKNIPSGITKHTFVDVLMTSGKGQTIITNRYLKDSDTKKSDSIVVTVVSSSSENVLYNNTTNNRSAYVKQTTLNREQHTVPTDTLDGGFGATNVLGGNFVVCYDTPCPIKLCALDYSFFALAGGNQQYKLVVYGDSSAGIPGRILNDTNVILTSPPAGPVAVAVTHFFDSPIIIPAGKYYVGVRQLTATNIALGYQNESPMKPQTYFYQIPRNTAVWTDHSNAVATGGIYYRTSVGVRTELILNLGVWLEGFFDGTSMVPDTVCLIAHKFTPPYAGLDTAYAVVGSNGVGTFSFCRLNNDSCYFYEVRHRNHIATWSHNLCEKIDECGKLYDFRNNITQAFGNNMIFVAGIRDGGGGFAIYGGDPDQDGCVTISDCAAVDNDAANFVQGYVDTDLNGDGLVDLADLALCENNSFNFVCSVTP